MIRKLYRALRYLFYRVSAWYSWLVSCVKFSLNGVEFERDFIGYGIPVVNVSAKGKMSIGNRFMFNSGKYYNMVGRQQPCYFIVADHAHLNIGNNVGLSSVAIVCHNYVEIGDNVKIGGNVVIYDTDFHSLDARYRNSYPEQLVGVRTRPVIIQEGAFIGAHSTILKGVTIGRNAIIGAGSVVNTSVPDGQIWMGNPAKYIREAITEEKVYAAEY